jgi:1-acyl-sn-glycerol-3-phosphate acyltransferase
MDELEGTPGSVPALRAQFKHRRKDRLADVARVAASTALTYHRIAVDRAERLPTQGPALLLPKHHAYRDILIEGVVLHRVTHRYATYVMKTGLFGVLGLLGGVKIVRPKDIRRLKDREARRERIRWAREANQGTMEYLSWLYVMGEMVISHPEGMRYQNTMGPLQKEIIEHLIQVENTHGLRIPIIPIGLEYESYGRPRSWVHVRVGEPFFAADVEDILELMGIVNERIRTLSGL